MIEALFKLRRAPSGNENGDKAPHKPVLLLALIQEIEEGRIRDNRVYISPDLLASFKEIWSRLVSGNWECKFFLPFYHMQNDTPKFWFLETAPRASIMLTSKFSPKSVRSLLDAVDYAYFSDWLWEILTDSAKRERLRNDLLAQYFPHKFLPLDEVHRSSEHYRKQLELDFYENRAADWLPNAYEREALRGAQFKNYIPKIYNHTCAISRQRIIAFDTQMIDACHIKPWSESKDDTIQNGIALTPTLHRAFDRGIVKINPDYKVWVSPDITESSDSPFNLTQFQGTIIHLPNRKEYWPKFS